MSFIEGNKAFPSLVYVTHHVEEILPMFKKALLLKEGKIIRSGRTDDVLTSQTLKQLYAVSLKLLKKNGRYWSEPI